MYRFGLRCDGQRRLRVSRVRSRRRSQRCMGNLLLQLLSMAIRWYLNFWITRLGVQRLVAVLRGAAGAVVMFELGALGWHVVVMASVCAPGAVVGVSIHHRIQ